MNIRKQKKLNIFKILCNLTKTIGVNYWVTYPNSLIQYMTTRIIYHKKLINCQVIFNNHRKWTEKQKKRQEVVSQKKPKENGQ